MLRILQTCRMRLELEVEITSTSLTTHLPPNHAKSCLELFLFLTLREESNGTNYSTIDYSNFISRESHSLRTWDSNLYHLNNSKILIFFRSVMFRNAEDKVAQLFQKNKTSNSTKEVQLVDPLQIQLDMKNIHREESTQSELEKERVVNQARQRYVHEKKIIVFIMHTCRKLRNLAK